MFYLKTDITFKKDGPYILCLFTADNFKYKENFNLNGRMTLRLYQHHCELYLFYILNNRKLPQGMKPSTNASVFFFLVIYFLCYFLLLLLFMSLKILYHHTQRSNKITWISSLPCGVREAAKKSLLLMAGPLRPPPPPTPPSFMAVGTLGRREKRFQKSFFFPEKRRTFLWLP